MASSISPPCHRMPTIRGFRIEECSITDLQVHMTARSFSSRDLAQCYLERISAINCRLRAVIETNPDAVKIADLMDQERRDGKQRSRLHGIPFIVKDNICTRDRMQTTAGSAALFGTVVAADARVVALLREAGAVLLGKGNMSEFASMRASYYAEGYSSRGGQNRNPYNLAHHAGGSSSGPASAVAANMCAFSIGTETDGSIMFPADRNAVVGIKPTVGVISASGVIPEAPSLDTVGPFARSVMDAALVLDVIRECCEVSISTSNHSCLAGTADEKCPGSFMNWLATKEALRGARFGLPRKRVWETASKHKERSFEYNTLMEFIRVIEDTGATIIEVDIPSAGEIIPPYGWDWEYAEGSRGSALSEFSVVRFEFYRSIQKYLSTLQENENNILSLEDIIAYNIEHTAQEGGVPGTHPAWPSGQDNFEKCMESKNWPEHKYAEALAYIRRKSRAEGIDAALLHEGEQLDGLLVPLQVDGGVACSLAAKAGYPMITVPVGVGEDGVPFGLGIVQTARKDHLLVKYGSAIEDLIRGRQTPQFLNWDAENYPYIGESPYLGSMKVKSVS